MNSAVLCCRIVRGNSAETFLKTGSLLNLEPFELPTLSFETFPEFTTYCIHADLEQYVFVQITTILLAS